ncbi:MAG: type IX secretion system sortase PorU [Candidatus Latescibacterota bacterium]
MESGSKRCLAAGRRAGDRGPGEEESLLAIDGRKEAIELTVARIIGTAILLIACTFPSHSLAKDQVKLLSETNDRLVVDIQFDHIGNGSASVPPFLSGPGQPPLHFTRFFLAVKNTDNLTVTLLDGTFEDSRGGLPQLNQSAEAGADLLSARPGLYPAQPCVASPPFRYRNHLVIAVDCFSQQVDYATDTKRQWARCRVEVRYSAVTPAEAAGAKDPLLAERVMNTILPAALDARAASRTERSGREAPTPTFSRADHWVKVRVTERGIHKITGDELFGIGVDISSIDPNSLRLFTAGGVQQSRLLGGDPGLWHKDTWLQECALIVHGSQDGTLDPMDDIVFYGLGSREWLDYYQPGASPDAHYDHPFAGYNIYFLTWNGSFAGSPLRMTTVQANLQSAPEYTTYRAREHFEQDNIEIFDYGDDGWYWLSIPNITGPETNWLSPFTIKNLVAYLPQEFRTVAAAPYKSQEVNTGHHAVYKMNNVQIAEHVWSVKSLEDHFTSAPRVTATGNILQEGVNQVSLFVPRDLNAKDFMYFAWFEVRYHKRLIASNDILAFSTPDTMGTIRVSLRGFSRNGSFELFDVTNPYRPQYLIDYGIHSDVTEVSVGFSTSLSGERKHFWAAKTPTYKTPLLQRFFPADLKNAGTSPHMLIICNSQFKNAANILKAHRMNRLPYFSSPNVQVVTTAEVFDNFSGGLPDPMAIRNYCKFLYDNYADGGGSPLLTFVLLLGDANTDYKNIATSQPDYVPTNLNLSKLQATGIGAYATDEWFAYMDPEDELIGRGVPDLAIGRLPAASSAEAFFLVNKTIQYETAGDYHPWRGKAIFVADDEVYAKGQNQTQFVQQSEYIILGLLPQYVDFYKIYLTEFPWVQGIKPDSRRHFLEKWNEGALLINYIGHGSSISMADEQVFLAADVATLQNGYRLPIFMAMSCTIGDFNDPLSKSLAEKLLLKEGGGAIGTITASQESFIGANSQLNYGVIRSLYPDSPGAPDPMGVALMMGKINAMQLVDSNQHLVENNQKYNLLGDPALTLELPRYEIEFANNDADTLIAGVRKVIEGSVLAGDEVDTSFSGVVHLLVREPDDASGYITVLGDYLDYRYHRGVMYRGTSQVDKGRFSFSFRVPRFLQVGPYIYLTAYAENGQRDAIVTKNTGAFALVNPSPSDPVEPIDGPPHVTMGFRGGLKEIKPGAELQAFIRDPDGVNILSTTNEGKQALIFDDSNLPIDVTEFFVFDHGGSDTSGVLTYPLTNIAVGNHQAVFKVSDSFGQTTIDTLQFTVMDPLAYTAQAVFNYPNPFSQETHFLFMLSDPASIDLDIFTISGRKIRKLKQACEAGEAWVYWDGRDQTGGEIANGAYLYVARVAFKSLDRPPVVLRGKIVKIE